MRHELLVAVEDGDVEVGVGVADEAPAEQVLQSNNPLQSHSSNFLLVRLIFCQKRTCFLDLFKF